MSKRLLIRADAGPDIGAGHVMRCLAIAQAWRLRGGAVSLLSARHNPGIQSRLRDEGVELAHFEVEIGSAEDARQTAAHAVAGNAAWLILDGYRFDTAYQETLGLARVPVMMMDDYVQSRRFAVDLVVNQNIYAEPGLYARTAPGVRALLGSDYVLLRREFWQWRGCARQHDGRLRRILVTLGGADPDNATRTIMEGIASAAPEIETVVVVGGNNPHREGLAALAESRPGYFRIMHDVRDMPELIRWADFAFCAGGATCWEMAFLGTPFATTILAMNQERIARCLAEAELSLDLGWHHTLSPVAVTKCLEGLCQDPARLADLSRRGQALVDGRGVERVVDVLWSPRAGA